MKDPCDLQIHVDGQQDFFLNEKVVSTYSEKLKKLIVGQRRRIQNKISCIIELDDFPGGPQGFELVSRFCYNNGRITLTVSNVSILHCCAVFLGMTEDLHSCNLIRQTQNFLDGMFDWSWSDVLQCLRSCESFFSYAESSGLIQKLICSLLAKISQNSDTTFITSSSSSSSSPENTSRFRISSSTKTTPEFMKPCSSAKAWWFNDMATLPPKIIEKLIQSLGIYGRDNSSLILSRFLLHYLKTNCTSGYGSSRCEYSGLADTAVHGVILAGKTAFSCRGLFWVLRVVSGFGLSKDCRAGLERLIGGMLDQATLDDLLVSGHERGIYDVNLVLRLIRVFVHGEGLNPQRLKKVGRLLDKYLGEISPDQNLKISKFLAVAESLPDAARDCFDGVYRAIDIYLESHPNFSSEERTRVCRCINFEKLSLEACKELAKNPRIPPRIAMEALISQQSGVPLSAKEASFDDTQMENHLENGYVESKSLVETNEIMRLNLHRMQARVLQLEKVCKQMKGHMSRMGRDNKTLPRLC